MQFQPLCNGHINNDLPNISKMRTPLINEENNWPNSPDRNTNSDKDKRHYQEEYFGTILKSLFDTLTNTPNSKPTSEAEIWHELAKLLDDQFKKLIWQLTAISSDYLISKKQGTVYADYFLYKLQAEILKPLQMNIYNTPNNFWVVYKDDIEGIDKTRVISFLKQQKDILNRLQSINFTVLVDFLIGVTTNLSKLKS
jgi:hypothetical protein